MKHWWLLFQIILGEKDWTSTKCFKKDTDYSCWFLKKSLKHVKIRENQKKRLSPTNTYVETTCKRSFPRRLNVEYTWCVCMIAFQQKPTKRNRVHIRPLLSKSVDPYLAMKSPIIKSLKIDLLKVMRSIRSN